MRARGVSPVVQYSVGHIRFAVCAERSRDNNLRFLRQFHADKIWNTLITITYLHMQFKFHLKVKHRFLAVLYSKKYPALSIPALCLLCKMSYREVARERKQFLMTHLQISAIGSTPHNNGTYYVRRDVDTLSATQIKPYKLVYTQVMSIPV